RRLEIDRARAHHTRVLTRCDGCTCGLRATRAERPANAQHAVAAGAARGRLDTPAATRHRETDRHAGDRLAAAVYHLYLERRRQLLPGRPLLIVAARDLETVGCTVDERPKPLDDAVRRSADVDGALLACDELPVGCDRRDRRVRADPRDPRARNRATLAVDDRALQLDRVAFGQLDRIRREDDADVLRCLSRRRNGITAVAA